jgi:hypothetical protein
MISRGYTGLGYVGWDPPLLFGQHEPGYGWGRLDPPVQHHFLADLFPDIVGWFPGSARAPDRAQFSVAPLHVVGQPGVGDVDQVGADMRALGVGRCLRKAPLGLYPFG